jgi:hypothetical protein
VIGIVGVVVGSFLFFPLVPIALHW